MFLGLFEILKSELYIQVALQGLKTVKIGLVQVALQVPLRSLMEPSSLPDGLFLQRSQYINLNFYVLKKSQKAWCGSH